MKTRSIVELTRNDLSGAARHGRFRADFRFAGLDGTCGKQVRLSRHVQ